MSILVKDAAFQLCVRTDRWQASAADLWHGQEIAYRVSHSGLFQSQSSPVCQEKWKNPLIAIILGLCPLTLTLALFVSLHQSPVLSCCLPYYIQQSSRRASKPLLSVILPSLQQHKSRITKTSISLLWLSYIAYWTCGTLSCFSLSSFSLCSTPFLRLYLLHSSIIPLSFPSFSMQDFTISDFSQYHKGMGKLILLILILILPIEASTI